MMNAGNLNGKARQMKDWRRRFVALVAALSLLISSCGLTAFAESDEGIYSAPVTAPIAPDTTPEPEKGAPEVTPAPEGQEETGTEPGEGAGEVTGEATGTEPGAESGEETGTEPGEEAGTESGEETGTEPGEEAGTESGEETGTEPGEEAGTESGEETGTEPGEEAGTESGEVTGTETEGEPEVTGETEPEDLTVYEPGALAAEADGVTVALDYTAEARIPADTVLTLTPTTGADLYTAMKSAARVLKDEQDETWKREIGDEAVFYNLTLTTPEGDEVHPATGVTLTCSNLVIPAGATGFVTGPNAENLDWSEDLTLDFLPDAIGYAVLKQVQIGTITLVHNDRDYMVTASYGPDAGFPFSTELKVREIMPGTPEYALYSGMTDEALNEDWSEITLERYFDIAFVKDGVELEPQADVDVQITFHDKIEENDDTEVAAVHIENNEATVIESETDSQKVAKHDDEAIDTVSFTSDSFSVYGVVQKKKIVTKVLTDDGISYEIEVTYTQEAEIPENAQVKVEEIEEGSDLWEAYRIQTAAALNADDVRLPGLYDITIVDEDGNPVEPKAAVNVAIRLLNAENTTDELHVVHFTEEMPQEFIDAAAEAAAQQEEQSVTAIVTETGTQTETQSTEQTEVQARPEESIQTIESETITAKVEDNIVTFDTQSFSVYAFAYTVDFYYGEYEYHLDGGGAMALSELFALLNIDANVSEVASVEFSNPELLAVVHITEDTTLSQIKTELGLSDGLVDYIDAEGEPAMKADRDFKAIDWALISLKPFLSHEWLTVTMNEKDVYRILVEDFQQASGFAYHFLVNANHRGYFSRGDKSLMIEGTLDYNSNNHIVKFDFNQSKTQYVLVAAENGSHFVTWLRDDGGAVNTGNSGSSYAWKNEGVNVEINDRDVTFVAYFAPDGAKLITVSVNDLSKGRVNNTNWVANREDLPQYRYTNNDGKSGNIVAVASAWDKYFKGWYLDDGTLYSTNQSLNPSEFTTDTHLTAVFEDTFRYNIITNEENKGYFEIPNYNTTNHPTSWYDLPSEAVPNEGVSSFGNPVIAFSNDNSYEFDYWLRDDGADPVADGSSLLGFKENGVVRPDYNELTRLTTYIAVFKPKGDYIIRVNSPSEGGYPGQNGGNHYLRDAKNTYGDVFFHYYYAKADRPVITATAYEGWIFDGWYDEGNLISTDTSFNIGAAVDSGLINRDMNLTPVFKRVTDVFHVWFDGTNGLGGGDSGRGNTLYARSDRNGNVSGAKSVHYTVQKTGTATIPDTRTAQLTLPKADEVASPMGSDSTHFTLQGWYEVYSGQYYKPGETITISSDCVFYADWFADNYSFAGAGGSSTDTSGFITTHVFDYNNLFNMDSIYLDTSRSVIPDTQTSVDDVSSYNKEYWSMKGESSDFIFMDTVSAQGRSLNPYGRDYRNSNRETSTDGSYYTAYRTTDLLTGELRSRLFSHSDGLGKRYLGTGNYLFKYDSSTGYYYFDSDRNAASYNQGAQRFYVYDYQNKTNKSTAAGDWDFLPLNCGNTTFNETYGAPNYWFGMSSSIRFFLPNEVNGEVNNNDENLVNKPKIGDEMIFKFAGDDDVWVYVDGKLVLDMGGIHGKVYGEINFSRGTYSIVSKGAKKGSGTLTYEASGDQIETYTESWSEGNHTLTIYYLERGGSQSNCAIYFNLAPRYSLRMEKQDGSSKLAGAKFGIFTDEACTAEAKLIDSLTDDTTNEFLTDENGVAICTGLVPGNTYYIKEVVPPDGYPNVSGETIKLEISAQGEPAVTCSNNWMVTEQITSSETGSGTQGEYLFTLKVNNRKITSVTTKKTWSLFDGEKYVTFDAEGNKIDLQRNSSATATVKLQRSYESESGEEVTSRHKVTIYEGCYASGDVPVNNTGSGSLTRYKSDERTVDDGGKITIPVTSQAGIGIYSVVATNGSFSQSKSGWTSDKPFYVDGGKVNLPTANTVTLSNIQADTTVYIIYLGAAASVDELKGRTSLGEITVAGRDGSPRKITKDTAFNAYPTDEDGNALPNGGQVTLSSANNWTATWDNLKASDEGRTYYYYIEEVSASTPQSSAVAGAAGTAFIQTTSSDGVSGGTITVNNGLKAVKVKLRKQDRERDSGGNRIPLQGGEFHIYTNTEYQKLIANQTATPMTPDQNLISSGEMGAYSGSMLTADSAGRFYFGMLPAGKYYIVEETAPNGYQKLNHPITIEVTDEGLKCDMTGGDNLTALKADSDGFYNLYIDNDKMVTTSITVRKNWNGSSAPADASVEVILGRYKLVDDVQDDPIQTDPIQDDPSVQETCMVTFAAGEGSGSMNSVTVNKGAAYTLPECTFTAPSGKEFDHWNVGTTGAAGEQITVNDDITITALWKDATPASFTVTLRITGDGVPSGTWLQLQDVDNNFAQADSKSIQRGTGDYTLTTSETSHNYQICFGKGSDWSNVTISGDYLVDCGDYYNIYQNNNGRYLVNGGTYEINCSVATSGPHTVTVQSQDNSDADQNRRTYLFNHGTSVTATFADPGWEMYAPINNSGKNLCFVVNGTDLGIIQKNATFTFTVNADVTITLMGTGYNNFNNVVGQLSFSPNPNSSSKVVKDKHAGFSWIDIFFPRAYADEAAIHLSSSEPTLPEAPAGKKWVKDTSWTNDSERMVTLSGGTWTDTRTVDATDSDGNVYLYYINEVFEYNVDSSRWSAAKDAFVVWGDHATNTDHSNDTLSVTNTYHAPTTGSLTLRKDVKFDGAELTLENSAPVRGRTYHFTIIGPSDTWYVLAEAHGGDDEKATVFKYYVSETDYGYNAYTWYNEWVKEANWDEDDNEIYIKTFGDDEPVLIDGLEPGQYTITEDAVADMVTSVSNNGGTSETTNTITVNVTAGTTASAQVVFTNNFQTGSLKLKKIVNENGSLKTDASGDYYFSLQRVDENDDLLEDPMYIKLYIVSGIIDDYRLMTKEAYDASRFSVGKVDGTTTDGVYFNHAKEVDGYYAILPGLVPGDYWLKEISLPEGVRVESIVRGDNNTSAVDLTDNKVKVHVTAGVNNPDTSSSAAVIYTNETWHTQLSIRKVAQASTSSPVNGDLSKVAGYYSFTVAGPVNTDNTLTGDAIQKYIRIYATYDKKSKELVYSYEIKDADSGWDKNNARRLAEGTGAELDHLNAGDYLITETGWQLDSAAATGTEICLNDITTTPSDKQVAQNIKGKYVKVHVEQSVTEVQAVFTNELVPNTMNHRKMVLDTNDSSEADPFNSGMEHTWEDSADYDIGDQIPYRVTGYLPQSAYKEADRYYYRVDDVMQNLEFVNGTGHMFAFVKGPTETVGKWYQVDEYFTVSTPASMADTSGAITSDGNDTMKYLSIATNSDAGLKAIVQGYLTTWGAADTHANDQKAEPTVAATSTAIDPNHIQYLQFRYKARLLDTANIGSTGNANDAKIVYGDGENLQSTGWDRNRVFTYKLVVNKQDENRTALSGATFQLFKKYVAAPDGVSDTETVNGDYHFFGGDAEKLATIDTSVFGSSISGGNYYLVNGSVNGNVYEWNGIDDGSYILVETGAPEHYAALSVPIGISINAKHQMNADDPALITNGTYVNIFPENNVPNVLSFFVTTDGSRFNGNSITANIPNAPLVDITASKTWENAENAVQPTAIEFTLYRSTTDSEAYDSAADTDKFTEDEVMYLKVTDGPNPVRMVPAISGETVTWSPVTWQNMPKYADIGTTPLVPYSYKVRETGVYFGELAEDDPETTETNEAEQALAAASFVSPMMYVVTGGDVAYGGEGHEHEAAATIMNSPKTVDVPVEKTWDDFEDPKYSWTATFQLEELETKVSGEDAADANTTTWMPIEGKTITISKGQTEDISFNNLPLYRTHSNGSVYRIIYSVDETGYEVRDGSTVVAKWVKGDESETVGSDIYTPQYTQDAGDADFQNTLQNDLNEWYKIKISNTIENKVTRETLDITLQKTWADGAFTDVPEENASATFELVRYSHEEYRNYAGVPDMTDMVSYQLGSQEITVPRGTQLAIEVTFKAGNDGNGAAIFQIGDYNYNTATASHYTIATGNDVVRTESFIADANRTITVLNGGDKFISARIVDTLNPTQDVYSRIEDTVTITKGDHWTKTWTNLPKIVEDEIDTEHKTQTVHFYSYYLRETASDPAGFYATFTAEGAEITEQNRIGETATVEAENKPIPPFVVKKVWRGVPDPVGYPDVTFDLYQAEVDGNGYIVGSATIAKRADGTAYSGIVLSYTDNNYTWSCPEYLPDVAPSGNRYAYYVVENPAQSSEEEGQLAWTVYGYSQGLKQKVLSSNENGVSAGYYEYNSPALPEQPQNAKVIGNEGELVIHNKVTKYIQMDMQKQYFIIREDGSWLNISSTAEDADLMVHKGIVLGFKVIRRIRTLDGTILRAWHEYGNEMRLGFDASGNPVHDDGGNPFILQFSNPGSWEFTILNGNEGNIGSGDVIGLPSYGIYMQDGVAIPVKYNYSYRETGVYSDLAGTPHPRWEWINCPPDRYWDENGALHEHEFGLAFANHDGKRIVNYQASNIIIDKRWLGKPDAQEVYVKIFRKTEGGDEEDFTKIIADDIKGYNGYEITNWQNYVSDTSIVDTTNNWIVIKSRNDGDWTTTVKTHRAVLGSGGAVYQYYIREVGYKDKNGEVHLVANDAHALDIFETRYTRWDSTEQKWLDIAVADPTQASITLGRSGTNRLQVMNAPMMDLKVEKRWLDQNGLDKEPWQNEVNFMVKQTRTRWVNGAATDEKQEVYLTAGNSRIFTLKQQGQTATLTTNHTDHDVYSMTVSDSNVGDWTVLIKDLQRGFFDAQGYEWHCEYSIEEVDTVYSSITYEDIDQHHEIITVKNTYDVKKAAVKVTKAFSGVEALPSDFTISATWKDDENNTGNDVTKVLTLANAQSGDGSEEHPYVWTINEIPAGNTVTFAESNYIVEDLNVVARVNGTKYTGTGNPAGTAIAGNPNDADAAEAAKATINFVNEYGNNEGSLKIIKVVPTPSGSTETDFNFEIVLKNEDGTYYEGDVTVTDKTRTTPAVVTLTADNKGKVTVTISGAGEAIIDGLPVGTTYEVTEQNTPGWRQVGEVVYSDTSKTIAAGEEHTATITNEEIVSIKAKKNWENGKTPYPGTEVVLSLSATVPGEAGTTAPNGVTITPTSVTLDGIVDTDETTAWEYEWTELPKYDGDGKLITYTVTETAYRIGEYVQTSASADATAAEGYNFSFTNPVPETEISVTKDWKKADSTTDYTPADTEKTVKFKVFYNVEGDTATPATEYPYIVGADSDGNYSISYTNGAWGTTTLSNLPMYVPVTVTSQSGGETSGGTTVVMKRVTGYHVVEQNTNGRQFTVTYQVGTGTAASTCGNTLEDPIKIINTNAKITVTKTFSGVDALPEDFTITASWTVTTPASGEGEETTTQKSIALKTTGEATGDVIGLTVTRTKTDAVAAAEATENTAAVAAQPAIYTWTIEGLPVDTRVTFTESNYSVAGYTWVGTVKESTDTEAKEGISGSGTVTAEGQTVAFTNTYTPGVELPATGGPGSAIYTVAGLMLIILAGVLMIAKRRRYNR